MILQNNTNTQRIQKHGGTNDLASDVLACVKLWAIPVRWTQPCYETSLSQPLVRERYNHIVTAVTLVGMHLNHTIQNLHSSGWKDVWHICASLLWDITDRCYSYRYALILWYVSKQQSVILKHCSIMQNLVLYSGKSLHTTVYLLNWFMLTETSLL